MAAVAGYNSSVKIGGVSTAMTGEACTTTGVDPGKISQITSTAKRCIDPAVAIVVYDNGAPVAATDFSVNYLFGKITFTVAVTGPVTIDGNYIPLLTIAQAKELMVGVSATMLDVSVFSDTVFAKLFKAGLMSAKGSITIIDTPDTDYDSGVALIQSISDDFLDGTQRMIDCVFGGSGDSFRAWVFFENLDDGAEVDGLFQRKVGWICSAKNSKAYFAFSWQ